MCACSTLLLFSFSSVTKGISYHPAHCETDGEFRFSSYSPVLWRLPFKYSQCWYHLSNTNAVDWSQKEAGRVYLSPGTHLPHHNAVNVEAVDKCCESHLVPSLPNSWPSPGCPQCSAFSCQFNQPGVVGNNCLQFCRNTFFTMSNLAIKQHFNPLHTLLEVNRLTVHFYGSICRTSASVNNMGNTKHSHPKRALQKHAHYLNREEGCHEDRLGPSVRWQHVRSLAMAQLE